MGREFFFFPLRLQKGLRQKERENLQMQDFVSAPFIKAPSKHQDLNWSQTGVIL